MKTLRDELEKKVDKLNESMKLNEDYQQAMIKKVFQYWTWFLYKLLYILYTQNMSVLLLKP